MLFWFLMGLLIGAGVIWVFYLSSRREAVRLNEEKQLLHQEKQIVVGFMHNLVEAIGSGIDRTELFQRIVHAAILSTGALSACVFEKTEKGNLRGVAVEGLFPPQRPLPEKTKKKISTRAKFIEQVLKAEEFDMGEGLIGSVARSGSAVLIEDATNDPRVVQHEDTSLVVRSIIVAPIFFREKILGVLAVANPADGMSFNETDFSLVQSLAEQAAMAIHNSDLMKVQIEKNKLDFDLTMASSIQGMLLPEIPTYNAALDIDAFYRPAQKIGGDLYDIIPLDENRVALAIADVSGKGVPAALLMAICQTNLRHFVHHYDSPSDVLKAMNKAMSGDIRHDMFITLICAVVDTQKNVITFARAGHELLLHTKIDSDIGEYTTNAIGGEGMAVGMVPPELFDAVIADKTIPFKSGETILLYTDGVTEASDEKEVEYSENRLKDVITTLRERSANELNESIVASVERYTGQDEFMDDLTLICVKHN